MAGVRFSQRLAWGTPENALAALEREKRATGVALLDLTVSNPTAVSLPDQGAALAAALANPTVGTYRPSALGSPAARALVAGEYARLGASVAPDHIALTASSSESYALLFKLLCDPGDVVLVPEPSYPLFTYLAGLEGVATRRYRLAFDGEWHIDWSSVDPAGARALVVVSPNNPTGSFLRAADWRQLGSLATVHDFALVVDEVFADYAFTPASDAVVTVARSAPPALTFALGGLSKGAALPQMKLGWIVALGPDAEVARAVARLELLGDTYLSVGTPVLAALPALLAIGALTRSQVQARVSINRAALSAALRSQPPVSWLAAEGGWSAILRVPAIHSEEAWALTLLRDHDLLIQPGYFFDLTGLGSTLVLSLLPEPAIFAEGLRRLLARVCVG